ncbi:hypothetical protein Tco_0322422 [Tanacetum coccineum]
MQIPALMITDEMKQMEHYRMTTSAPRSPNPDKEAAESSAPRRSTVIRLCIPERKSTRLTPPALVPTVDKADEMILQDTLQVSLAEHKSREEQEARENVALRTWHLKKLKRCIKESPEVEITKDKEVEITNVVIPVNVNDDDEEITDEVYELKIIEKGKLERGNIQAQISTQIENAIANVIPSQVDASVHSYMSGHTLHVHLAQSQTSSVPDQQYQLYLAMKADPQLQQQDIAIWLSLQMKFERNTVLQIAFRTHAVRPRDQDDPHDDAHLEGENSAKRQKTSEYEAYVSGESSSGQFFRGTSSSTSGIKSKMMILIFGLTLCLQMMIRLIYVHNNGSPGIEDHEMFSIIYEPVHGIIYKNNKKEKRVMRHSEIYKFCDATLNRVLEGLKSYNNDVKYGYVQKDLTKEEAEYLILFEEEMEERLKHRR